jgi:mono/diheme cytochrome c family protein
MVRSTAGVVAAGAMALGACASANPALDGSALALQRGRQIAERLCVACHAVEPGKASSDPRAPAFGSLEMRHTASLEGRVGELTRRGHYSMPPIGLNEAEIRELVAYIASLDAR